MIVSLSLVDAADTHQTSPQCLRRGSVVVYPAQHVAWVGHRLIKLTRNESAMLQAMIAAGGRPVKRADLAAVWSKRGKQASGRSVDTRVYALRRKLGDDARHPQIIVTVSGLGYAIHIDLVVEEDGGYERRSRYRGVVGGPHTEVA